MENAASPYFGGPKIRALQEARDKQVGELSDLPGAVIHGRVFSSDDPDALGWSRIREVMAEEGMVSLRGVDNATLSRACEELAEFEPVVHRWDMFMADVHSLRAACVPNASAPLAEGLFHTPKSEMTSDLVHEVQHFLSEQGVSPFSKDALMGRLFPARLLVLQHSDGRIAAAGFAAMTHNRHSPFFNVAWVGLIAVDPELRGLGLGKQVDAMSNLVALDELGASATMEFVAQDNAPSRAMLESCGLRNVEGKTVVVLSKSADRISR
ncbi:GNAT family N-acetyltransferase (plasmid) [Rhodobacteraceae bacterium SC52]|nr:GNAT family N-acetyltransferase [Rhodobacteraceae bacterium SC52]